MAIYIIAILGLVALSTAFSGAEAAFLSVSDIRLRTLSDKNNRKAAEVLRLKANMRQLLVVLLAAQTISDICSSALATAVATKLTGDIGIGLAAGLMSLTILVIGNLAPKSLAAKNPEGWVLAMVRPVKFMMWLLRPLVVLIDRSAGRFLPLDAAFSADSVSEEEIRTMAKIGVQAGTVESGEKEMIERVFLFNDINAFDVMTPWEEMVMISGDSTIAETMGLINRSGFSRYPVFDGDKAKVIGVVHIKDMFKRLADEPEGGADTPVLELVEPAVFVPKTKPIDDLLQEFQKLRNHMALVVNEHGSIVGLVTLEDLLEELVGEIADESDVDKFIIKRVDKDTIIVHGEVEVKDVNRFLNTDIDAPDHKSLAWVLMKELGSIPTEGQEIRIADNLIATVEEMINLKINRIRLDKELSEEDLAE